MIAGIDCALLEFTPNIAWEHESVLQPSVQTFIYMLTASEKDKVGHLVLMSMSVFLKGRPSKIHIFGVMC